MKTLLKDKRHKFVCHRKTHLSDIIIETKRSISRYDFLIHLERFILDGVQAALPLRGPRLPPRQLQLDRLHRPVPLPLVLCPSFPR